MNNMTKDTLRSGYTTGTCAAAAAYAAICQLENRPSESSVSIELPEGGTLSIPIEYAKKCIDYAEAAVIKDAGDDPDITNGVRVVVRIDYCKEGDINFYSGEGIGTITKKGLSLPPGEPAINPGPRGMIRNAIRKITNNPVNVTVSIPGGTALAEKTFNPRLGITGGLSILGTTGIVRPFSRKAIQDTIRWALNISKENNISHIFLVPGNIGRRAAQNLFKPNSDSIVEVSNEWGFTIDLLSSMDNFKSVTIVGHPGKLAKLAEGKWDTHSSVSDSALEFINSLCVSHIPGFVKPEVRTVEGLLQALTNEQRIDIANLIANAIKTKVIERIDHLLKAHIILINMKGNEYGRSSIQ